MTSTKQAMKRLALILALAMVFPATASAQQGEGEANVRKCSYTYPGKAGKGFVFPAFNRLKTSAYVAKPPSCRTARKVALKWVRYCGVDPSCSIRMNGRWSCLESRDRRVWCYSMKSKYSHTVSFRWHPIN